MRRMVVCLAVGMLTVAAYAQWLPNEDVPAYHTVAPARGVKLPALLSGNQLSGPNFQYAWQKTVYEDAAKVPNVLYQLPCFCRCDRALGHTSLHSCFEGLHGAECSTCAQGGVLRLQNVAEGQDGEADSRRRDAQGLREHRSEFDWHVAGSGLDGAAYTRGAG